MLVIFLGGEIMGFKIVEGKLMIKGLPVVIDNIKFDNTIGLSGNSGVVFFGRDMILDRKVAVKLWMKMKSTDSRPKELQGKFEARKSAQVNNSYFAQMYSSGTIDGYFYAIQEYIDGITLRDWLGSKPSLDERRWIWSKIVEAIKLAHAKNIYHGDLHWKNIILIEDSRQMSTIKIIDFGTSEFSINIMDSRARESSNFWKTAFKIFPEYKQYIDILENNKLFPPEVVIAGLDSLVKLMEYAHALQADSDIDDYTLKENIIKIVHCVVIPPVFRLDKIVDLLQEIFSKRQMIVGEFEQPMQFFLDIFISYCELGTSKDDCAGTKKYRSVTQSDLMEVVMDLYMKRKALCLQNYREFIE